MIDSVDECPPIIVPAIGKWMVNPVREPANWFMYQHEGKELREPINLVLVDEFASSPGEAKARLLWATRQAGYPGRRGHSSGYFGVIDGNHYPQLPEEKGFAFSDRPFFIPNNHGRIFGPASFNDSFVFIGAFSREGVAPLARVKHPYRSFNAARDHLAQKLHAGSIYTIHCKLHLNNAIFDSANLTTGDHDGYALVLRSLR